MFKLFLKFIFELAIPYGGSSFTRIGGISGLNDEAFYVPVKQAIVIVPTGTERKEILACLRAHLAKQFYFDVTDVRMQRYAHFSQCRILENLIWSNSPLI